MATAPIPAWRGRIAPLRYLAATVAHVHGPTHPEMAILSEVVATLAASHPGDHAAHAALGRRLRQLTGGFHPWSGSCASVVRLYQGLALVEADLPAEEGRESGEPLTGPGVPLPGGGASRILAGSGSHGRIAANPTVTLPPPAMIGDDVA